MNTKSHRLEHKPAHVKALKRIYKKLKRRMDNKNSTKFRGRTKNLAGCTRIESYKLGVKMIKDGTIDLLNSIPGISNATSNPFVAVLTAIQLQAGLPVTKSDRDRIRLIAMELQYAAERNVPPEFLIGKIYQDGGAKGIRELVVAARSSPKPRRSVAKVSSVSKSRLAGTSSNARSSVVRRKRPGKR